MNSMARVLALYGAAVAAAVVLVACGGKKTDDVHDAGHMPDAGHHAGGDAGVTADGGNGDPDAGHQDPDAGHEHPDAGHGDPDAGAGDPDGGTDLPDGGTCGDQGQPAYAVRGQGIAIPLDWSTCSANGCEEIRTVRLTDQGELEAFYANELQEPPPTVNWNLADVIVTYSCVCLSFGNTLELVDVQADACEVVTYGKLTRPGEDCFTQQTITRPYFAVEVPKGTGVTERADTQVTFESCE